MKINQRLNFGLWVEKAGIIYNASSEPECCISEHAGEEPAYSISQYENIDALKGAMRKIAPLRNWKNVSAE